MYAAYHAPLSMMMKISIIGTILLSVSLLTGCWGATIHGDKPNEYIETKNTIDSLHGSTREDIIRNIGKPKWTENRGGSTYFIYEWQRTDKMVGFFVLPIPIGGGLIYVDLYCLLLEFDENNNLINHESVSDSDDAPAEWGIADFAYNLTYKKDLDCIDILSKPIWYLIDGTGMFCPDELGQTNAQMRIGDIFYDGNFGVDIDVTRAYVWYSLASTSGNKGALRSLDKIERMSPALVTEALKLLEKWKPNTCSIELISRHRKLIQKEQNELDKLSIEHESVWRLDKNNIRTYCTNADSGDANAQKYLGDVYFFGNDVINTDLIRAYVWYSLTASNGDKEAIKQLHLLEDVLSQSQLGEAVRQTLDWKPGQCEKDLMEAISK